MQSESLKVVIYPNPILRKKCREVEDPKTPEIQKLILDMIKTMEENKGIGLSAPQVGLDLRICVIKVDNETRVFINPQIKSYSKRREIFEEGCLSFPGKYLPIERPTKIKVKAKDANGKKFKLKVDGLLSRVIQHEVDHLDGVLFIDRVAK